MRSLKGFSFHQVVVAWLLTLCVLPAWAGLSVYTSWSTLPPVTVANQRHVDFGPNTLEGEGARLSYTTSVGDCNRYYLIFVGWRCTLGSDTGSVTQSSSSSLNGFSGNALSVYSGHNNNSTSITVTFANPTPFVGFLWGAQFSSENTMFINLTLADNSVVTLKNCRDPYNNQCVGAYVSQNWLNDVYNFLLGWLLGDAIQYYPLYVKYEPSNGVKIKKVEFLTYECRFCGFLSADTPQSFKVDYLTYVDAAVAPHHLRVTAPANSTSAGSDFTYTVRACGNADCSLPWTSGVSGTLSFTGATPSVATQAFSIPAGPTNTATVTMRYNGTGTGTVGMTAHSPTASNTPKVFCGMGVEATSTGSCSVSLVTPPHHMEVTTSSATGLSCNPVTYTIKACADLACNTRITNGVSGTLVLSGAAPVSSFGFTTNGVGEAFVTAYATTPAAVTASLTGLSQAPTNNPAVFCGMGTGAGSGKSCVYTTQSSALSFDVPNHAAGTSQSVSVYAIKTGEIATRCVSAFANVTKAVRLTCAYGNPNSGSVPVLVNGTGLNTSADAAAACDGTGQSFNLAFDANGRAQVALTYADAGQLTVTASHSGSGADAGLSLTGSDTFVAVPHNLEITTTGPYVAGADFTATVRARNAGGGLMANFGNESPKVEVTLSKTGQSPTGGAAKSGTFSGSLGAVNAGVATSNAFRWTEVGLPDLSATVNPTSIYGSSGVSVGGTASGVGPFVPARFNVGVSQACAAVGKSAFTYSGEPFTVTVTALNALGGVTENHDGTGTMSASFAKAATLSATTNASTGSLTNTSVAASAFVRGVATLNNPRFTFSSRATAPTLVGLRATEVAPGSVSSSTGAEGTVALRSGRLKLSNAFGSGQTALSVPVQLQHWSGRTWVLNTDDSCTSVPASAVVLARHRDNRGADSAPWGGVTASGFTASSGQGGVLLSAPTGGATGSIDLALNLGDTALDASCLSAHPASTGAQRSWLRGQHGACVGTGDFDPSARATIGVFAPESRKVMHSVDLF